MSDDEVLRTALEAAKKRFEIYVPEPAVRLNFGQPASAAVEDGPFGYAGATLAVKDDIFLTAEGNVVTQATSSIIETAASHTTYAKDALHAYSSGTMTLGARGQMLVAAGTLGNSPHYIPTDHDALYLQSVNSIALHYRVDSLQMSLFEFLHGRRKHDAGKFDSKKAAEPILTEPELQGGFTKNVHRSLLALYPVENGKDPFFPSVKAGRDKVRTDSPELEDPVRWIDPLFRETKWDPRKEGVEAYPYLLFGSDDIAELEFGFSEYLAMFDPYRMWNPDGFSSSLLKRKFVGVNKNTIELLNLAVVLRRLRDVLNVFFFEQKSYFGKAAKVVGLVGSLGGAVGGLATKLENVLLNPPEVPDPFAPSPLKAVPGEGAAAAAGPYASPLKPLPSPDETNDPTRHAQVTSAGTTFDLSARTQWPMMIESDIGSEPIVINLGERKAAPAQLLLPVTPPPADANVSPIGLVISVDGVARRITVTAEMQRDPAKLATAIGQAFPRSLEKPVIVETDTAGRQKKQSEYDAASAKATPSGQAPSPTQNLLPGVDSVVRTATGAIESAGRVVTDGIVTGGEAVAGVLAPTAERTTRTIQLKTKRTGPSASIVVLEIEPEGPPLDFDVGTAAYGSPAAAAVAHPERMTVAEIAARFEPSPFYKVSVTSAGLRIESPTAGNGSRIEVTGELAGALFGGRASDRVIVSSVEDPTSPKNFMEVMASLRYWTAYISQLPPHLLQYLKPYIAKIDSIVGSIESMTSTSLTAAHFVAKAQYGRIMVPPENIGLIASQGIALATQDQILGVGGHGVVFVVDGASAGNDAAKEFQKQSKHMPPAVRLASGPISKIPEAKLVEPAIKQPVRATRQPSLGFRVMSDTVVDLDATLSAQLFAMGRGKATAARPDGQTVTGVGVARVIGSRASEVAAYEKVVISARSAGDPSDSDAKTGGRVELAGQTIAIGGMNLETQDPDGNAFGPFDLQSEDEVQHHHLGIAPFELDEIAGLEHILYSEQKTPGLLDKVKATAAKLPTPGALKKKLGPSAPDPADDPETDHLDMSMYCWPEKLRKEHPNTQRVYIHAAKESIMLGGPFMVGAVADVGVGIGRRMANKDPFMNDLDPKAVQLLVTDKDAMILVPNGEAAGTFYHMEATKISATAGEEGQGGAVTLEDGSVTLAGGNTSLQVDKSAGVTVDAPVVEVKSGGQIKIKGEIVYIN